jgi:hypothetical protein
MIFFLLAKDRGKQKAGGMRARDGTLEAAGGERGVLLENTFEMLEGRSAYRLLFSRALEVARSFANREMGYCHQRRHAHCKPINDRRWHDVHFSSKSQCTSTCAIKSLFPPYQ